MVVLPYGLKAEQTGFEAPERLTIGIFPRRNSAQTVRLFKPLRDYLELQLGIPVDLRTSSSFGAFDRLLRAQRFDLVHYNQYHYIASAAELKHELIAQNEEFGESKMRGAIIVRHDSGIRALQDLSDKTVLFGGGKQAMMSYIVPRYLLLEAGINPNRFNHRIASNPPNAVLATYLKQADAAGAGEVVIRLPVVTRKIGSHSMKILAQSEPLAHLPWAVKSELPEPFKQRLRDLLLDLKHNDAGRQVLEAARLTGFNAVTDADYEPHRRMIRKVQQADQGLMQ